MLVNERVEALRKLMKDRNIEAYIIPSSDYHESEYVGDYFKAREFISGFTGSAGTVVVTQKEAGLWTDGRYFIQAEKQLEGTGIKLFKIGEEGVPTIITYLENNLLENNQVGFDGRVITASQALELKNKFAKMNVTLSTSEDLVGAVWASRPELSKAQAFLLGTKYSGKSCADKLVALRDIMKQKNATAHIITTLDDIAWLFNIRGNDVKFNPVVLAYAVITLDDSYLFIDNEKLNDELTAMLTQNKVHVRAYEDIYTFTQTLEAKECVLLDPHKVNYTIYRSLNEKIQKVEEANPTILEKARKNLVEIENIRKGHIKDGVAFTKFMIWIKTNVAKETITEMSASQKLEDYRRMQDGFIEPSFNTIAGYKEHAAMMHYSANAQSDYTLKPEHMLLIDSGGQYYEGTTDITRTIVLGPIDDTLKLHFTSVVRGMINLSMAHFLQGVKGYNLDILARRPLWNLGLDYKCGTGHGVGYLLNVHEAPNGFRWKVVPERNDSCELEEGMVTTNEPGVYIEGSHGIRIENELVTRKGKKNEYGQFMYFETVTFAPIDLDGIDVALLNQEEKTWLNEYHQAVYEKISPYLDEEEVVWLKQYTRKLI